MSRLRKDDPVYYKAEINRLIKQAKDNGLIVGYEIKEKNNQITKIGVCFINEIAEMAMATIHDTEVNA